MPLHFILILAALTTQGLYAQNRDPIEVPFDLIEDRFVLIKGVMGKADTLTFYFDTGAATSAIDRTVAKTIGIQPNYKSPVSGAGGTEMYDVALNQDVRIGGSTISGVHMVLLDFTILREALGRKFDGIIGYHIIRDFITEVDFDRSVMTLYGKKHKPDLTGYTEHPIEFRGSNSIPVLPVTIELENGYRYEGDILFDSGAGLSLVINTPFVEKNDLREKFMRSYEYTTQNLNSISESTKVMLSKMDLCGYTLERIPVDLASDTEGVSSSPGFLGILGAEILNRFNFILDYRKMKLYLKPNALYGKPFEYRLSGITLRKSDEGIYVYQVVAGSSAYKAGIRNGDILISVNGIENGDISTYRKLLRKEGESVQLVVRRPDGIQEFTFLLKGLLE
jgi:hypothetical protein